jgi:hypothetical protein
MRIGRTTIGSPEISTDDWLGFLCFWLVILLITGYLVSRGYFRD